TFPRITRGRAGKFCPRSTRTRGGDACVRWRGPRCRSLPPPTPRAGALPIMYERFYHLRERPFALTPDPDYLYPSRVHKEALSYLRYGIESHAGFVVITGAIGSGKTTLLQTLLRGLDSQTTVARVMNTLPDRPELEQLRQRITVSYHLEALDTEETAHYINHRLARASVGAPMEFDRAVTNRIHARSGGVPRLINVIADATLVFGYGEERSLI